jgi:beta-glucosidase
VNQRGLDFYRRLIDALLEAGITPWVTLFHWDLPQALQDQGGWAARGTVDAFVRYAEVMAGALGDRVTHWITQNEPWVAAVLGHVEGIFAPGIRDWATGLKAGHHLLLSHGESIAAIRSHSQDAKIGLALDCRPGGPASSSPEDQAAWKHFDGYRNRWFFDPIFGRGYPDDMVSAYRQRGRIDDLSWVEPGDLEKIASPIDFIGINYYTSLMVKAGGEESEDTGVDPGADPPAGYTEMGWQVTPAALADFLKRVQTEYWSGSIYVTENGASYSDGPGPDGAIADDRRIEYMRGHIAAVESAIEAGVPVAGFFYWSLLRRHWSAPPRQASPGTGT